MKKNLLFSFVLLLFITSSFGQITLVQFSTGFSQPVDIKNCGDNRLFIVERAGTIKIIDTAGVHRPGNFLDIHTEVESGYNEQGLLGLAFDPNYQTTGYFYCYYTQKTTNRLHISRFTVSATNPDSADASTEMVLLDIYHPYLNHDGGDIAFGPDGYLYLGTGDGGSGNDPGNRSQNLDSLLGKLLRIDVSGGGVYSIPPSNPFVGVPGRDEIWAYGLRNPWRCSFDRWTGDLWIGDVGQNVWEEVDYQKVSSTGGENYGWHCYEGLVHTSGVTTCSPPDTTNPVAVVNHSTGSCALIGGYVYRGAKYSNMFGKYFFTDECLRNIKYLTPNGASSFPITDLGALTTGTTNDAFGEDAWGELFMSDLNGKIYKFHGQSCSPTAFITNQDSIFVCGSPTTTLHTPAGNGFHYSWSWSGGIIITDSAAIEISQDGDYFVSVLDDNGCSATSAPVHIEFVTPAVVSFTGLDTLYCVFDAAVTMTPNIAGGSFSGTGVSGSNFDPNTAGVGTHTITYTYTDVHGCVSTSSQDVVVDVCSGIHENPFQHVTMYPNPNTGTMWLGLYLLKEESVSMEVTDVLGQVVYYQQMHLNSGGQRVEVSVPGLAKGVYSLKVENEKGKVTKNFVVN